MPKATDHAKRGPLRPPETEWLTRVLAMVERTWHDEAGAQRFLTTPHPELDGRTPLEVAVTEAGAARVEELIERGRYGLPV
jgi:putative toxin-antitoxin system antitoxin component (TIGR02293 family)